MLLSYKVKQQTGSCMKSVLNFRLGGIRNEVKIKVFRDVTPCPLVYSYRHFEWSLLPLSLGSSIPLQPVFFILLDAEDEDTTIFRSVGESTNRHEVTNHTGGLGPSAIPLSEVMGQWTAYMWDLVWRWAINVTMYSVWNFCQQWQTWQRWENFVSTRIQSYHNKCSILDWR